jgi:hypothetical protein
MAANVIDPKILSVLAAARAGGGAPYTPQGPGGSPFVTGGGAAYTPAAAPNAGGGMSFGNFGQWALPRPAGVSLGYIPTQQTVGDPANAFDTAKRTLSSFIPPPPPAAAPVAAPRKVLNRGQGPYNPYDPYFQRGSDTGPASERSGSQNFGGRAYGGKGGLY